MGLALIMLLGTVIFSTEVKAEFELFVDSVSTTTIPGYVYVTGHLVDDPDGDAEGIPLVVWDQNNPDTTSVLIGRLVMKGELGIFTFPMTLP